MSLSQPESAICGFYVDIASAKTTIDVSEEVHDFFLNRYVAVTTRNIETAQNVMEWLTFHNER
ncbi:MAG: hypothetical protein AAF320_07035, partial [Myxococcota bacterium]